MREKKQDWDKLLNGNLMGVVRCVRAQLKVLGKGGSIVNAASVAGLAGSTRLAPYGTSKVC